MRVNGFAQPFSRDQVTSWILQPLLIGSFVALVTALLDRNKCLAILLPNAILVLLVLSSWTICESRNTAEPKPASRWLPSCLHVPHKETRYCTFCCKSSPGLDHHCTWLNTCIAEGNYEAFYCLVLSATCQSTLQAVVGILMGTLWYDEVKASVSADWLMTVLVLLWIHNVCCASLANSFFLLAGFHTYLLLIGSGTYDFILETGSDGLCARMLKCNCLKRSKKRRKKPKRCHVQDGDISDAKQMKNTTIRTRRGSPPVLIGSVGALAPPLPSPEQAKSVATTQSQSETEKWKAEWLAKYGGDDNDASGSHSGSGSATVAPAGVAASNGGKQNVKRSSTYPIDVAQVSDNDYSTNDRGESVGEERSEKSSFTTAEHRHVALSMGVNESEGIFEEVDLGPRQEDVSKSSSCGSS